MLCDSSTDLQTCVKLFSELTGSLNFSSSIIIHPLSHAVFCPRSHSSTCPPSFTRLSLSSVSHHLSLFLLSPQERGDPYSPSPAPSSTFYYQVDQELHQPHSSFSAAPEGPQPYAGHAPAGQLPGPASLEAERHPVRDDAPPLSTLPPVAAGDGPVLKVMEEETSPWKRRSEVDGLGLVGSGGGAELRGCTTENSDLQMTLI